MQWDIVIDNFPYLLWGAYPEGPLGGLALSVLLSIGGIFGAFWIGLAAGLMRLSKRWYIKIPSVIYIEIIRGVPLLMLIFWFYFLAPILLGKTLPEAESALVAFIVFTGAYIGEIVRAGVIALPKGQMEASRASGLSHLQAMRYVILPQALRNMIPSFVNQFVSLTKDTSLAYVIGVVELTRAAVQVNNRTLSAPMEIYLTILVMYFVICYVLTALSRKLEKKMARYQARG
ncbi:amino acid ABC transporter permease [Halodesulfovibrio marinisediminis]|uniref:Glutamate/aspartate import permease protein GltK n=1 Tax=Halodesulfovibrio marinisediminis DSM 17456 TaxID=1121457 RepID=A0A1N6DHB1_9BACT|nr:amino acid ABC transporter permease [Halodesulfovibrio marinisediminis]SIN70185.1 amino acid ABC transporter membrane protein 2, PAAT family [Halodesulfovibrio marinisediminis DSM 17456]